MWRINVPKELKEKYSDNVNILERIGYMFETTKRRLISLEYNIKDINEKLQNKVNELRFWVARRLDCCTRLEEDIISIIIDSVNEKIDSLEGELNKVENEISTVLKSEAKGDSLKKSKEMIDSLMNMSHSDVDKNIIIETISNLYDLIEKDHPSILQGFQDDLVDVIDDLGNDINSELGCKL